MGAYWFTHSVFLEHNEWVYKWELQLAFSVFVTNDKVGYGA